MRHLPLHHHCTPRPERRDVTLVFKRGELIYDVENYSFIEGDIIQTEDEHAKHHIFDVAQKGNIDRVTRVLNTAHAECVEMLYPYTKEEIPEGQEDLDDILREPEEYVINLSLPGSFSLSTVKLLNKLLHEYLVCCVLSDWMSITNPASVENWEGKRQALKRKIQTCLTSRRGPIRRKIKPF